MSLSISDPVSTVIGGVSNLGAAAFNFFTTKQQQKLEKEQRKTKKELIQKELEAKQKIEKEKRKTKLLELLNEKTPQFAKNNLVIILGLCVILLFSFLLLRR